MTCFKVVVAYDGTDYVGWQRQASGTSIQGLLEDALAELDGRPVAVTGAGRTDAGVHALGQAAGFSLERSMEAGAVVRAVNARLPQDVRVLSAMDVPAEFHARFDVRSKTYRYRFWNGDIVSPFERRYVWHIQSPLDVDAMNTAAHVLEGMHDFSAFQTAGTPTRTAERTVTSSLVRLEPPLVIYEISADGFLRHMIRAIAGTLVDIGLGRQPAGWMRDVLESRDRARAGRTAPPEGLFLARVDY